MLTVIVTVSELLGLTAWVDDTDGVLVCVGLCSCDGVESCEREDDCVGDTVILGE